MLGISWVKIGAAAAILLTVLGIFLGLKYVYDSQNEKIDKLTNDNKILTVNNEKLDEAVKNIEKENGLIRENQAKAFQAIESLAKTDSDILEALGKANAKVDRRDFDALKDSPHREMVLDAINRAWRGGVFPPANSR